jgi:hypothetical protein
VKAKNLPTLHLISIRFSIGIYIWIGEIDHLAQAVSDETMMKAKKPCLHPLYPMNTAFAEGEGYKKGFYYVGKGAFLYRTNIILLFFSF